MNILTWIVFGLVVGIIANLIDPKPAQGGMSGTILLGGFLGDLIFGVGVIGFNLSSFIVAVIGSLILLALSRAFRVRM
ncbi:MAG: Transglycosylase-associated protein [Candidatus Daviesbacteria bacterium GW2011_GWA2_42_7]|uniref:Transglycosylase-associated protein n=1 Tax=Candidatus Daviesbacteria bacterium GW2011_GWA2_42_7 TaxID=1618425 RepID=A0A0G1DH89_9BACT|nr:MAG: Transglycosylase-associated protein [Candidatus Daviesbacteria bacterium GW2011_GWA2_42_7]